MDDFIVRFLGARGSVPVFGKKYEEFGGATSSVFVRLDNKLIVFDAGSGIYELDKFLNDEDTEIHIFISHAHIDHIMGLPLCSFLFDEKMTVSIYGKTKNGMTIKDQLDKFINKPLWPVGDEVYRAKVNYIEIGDELILGNSVIKTKVGKHPNGVLLYRLEHNNKVLVYATDNEITDFDPSYIDFVSNADLLIFDGQYNEEDMLKFVGRGHSNFVLGANICKLANVKKLAVFHHDPSYEDQKLLENEKITQSIFENSLFARQGGVEIL